MSGQTGGVLFVAATAALALWVVVRRPWCPPTLGAVFFHAFVSLAALQVAFFLVGGGSPAWWRFAGVLVLVAPALVYIWLAAAWAAIFWKSARQGQGG
jgi:hypothetical protein